MKQVIETAEPKMITPESLESAAGSAEAITHKGAATADPVSAIRRAIEQVEPEDLLELAEKYYGRRKTTTTEDGERARKQPQTEKIVLVVDRFDEWLDGMGLGATVLNGLPHLYTGTHWKAVEDAECESILGRFAENLGVDVVAARFYQFRESLAKQFYSKFGGNTKGADGKPVLVNFLNGTLEITDGVEKLREFRKSDYLHYQLPFDYDESAKCSTFDSYLERVLPDPSSRMILAEFLGWLFVRDLKLEKVLVLYGDGHNGKSVFFDVVNALLGEHSITNYGLAALMKPEQRPALGGALLNFGSEIDSKCDPDLFKKLASGEPIEARKLYNDPFIMRDYARLAFNANTLPRETEQTVGYFRRFLIILFSETISEEEKDPDLAKKIIKSELSGVFNWVIKGLRRLREQRGFSHCEKSEKALREYKRESDSTALFLEEGHWKKAPEETISKADLYGSYKEFCKDCGYKPLGMNNFGKRLLNVHKIADGKKGSTRFWRLTNQ